MSFEQEASKSAKTGQPALGSLDLPSDESSEVSSTQEQVSETAAETSPEVLEASQDADDKIKGRAFSPSRKDSSEVIPVEKNVFYNQETLKYMRIIDKYKRLDVADIELPRVIHHHTRFGLYSVANSDSLSLRVHKALASPACLKT
jgi:hypothetical protein